MVTQSSTWLDAFSALLNTVQVILLAWIAGHYSRFRKP